MLRPLVYATMDCKYALRLSKLLANYQRHFINTYKKKSVDFDGDLHVLTLILRRADSQKPMAELHLSSPTPSQRDDWQLYKKILEEDYRAQNEDPKIYAARKSLEGTERKGRVDEQQKIVVCISSRHPGNFAILELNVSGALRQLKAWLTEYLQVRKYLDRYKM